jgi:hypothetical protein
MFRSWPPAALLLVVALTIVSVVACGGDDDDGSGSPTPDDTGPTPVITPGDPVAPPLEGPGRGDPPTEMTDFRELPEWQLPRPDEVPPPPEEEADNRLLNPPAEASCPEEWEVLDRPTDGYKICYPGDWTLAGYGNVSQANEATWVSAGIFRFTDPSQENQLAHVSIYVIPQFARPFRYTIDCEQPYSITFAGQPAVVCPEFPGVSPEAPFTSYHVFRENLDYFVQVVPYYLEEDGEVTDEIDEAAFQTAIDIAHTFQFTPVAVTPTPIPSPAPEPTQ